MNTVHYRAADIGGLRLRIAKPALANAPTLLLMHGFPTSGHMFRELIPLLADSFHLVAPDLPGFGQLGRCLHERRLSTRSTTSPESIDVSRRSSGLTRFAIYMFDYGAPSASALP